MARRQQQVATVKARRTAPLGIKLDHNAWRVLKRKHKAYSKAHHSPCWLAPYGMCLLDGVPIDYIHSGLPASYEADHKKPRDTHPHMVLDWNNLGASHLRCNRSRQAKAVVTQHVWVRPKW